MKLPVQSFKNTFTSEVAEAMKVQTIPGIVTEQDIKHLPDPIQNYLRVTGAIGKKKFTMSGWNLQAILKRHQIANMLNSPRFNIIFMIVRRGFST